MTTSDPSRITFSAPSVDQIAELLERCDEFLRHASPAVHAELTASLGPGASGYERNLFIDDLGFTAAYLRDQLAAVRYRRARATGQPS